jgi:peptide/nickel transport system permease protein
VDEADRVTSTILIEDPAELTPARLVADPARQRMLGLAYLVPGVILGILALFVLTSTDATWRSLIGFAGFGLVFAGAQTLGRLRFGSRFSVGLWLAIFWLALTMFCAIFADLLPIDHYDKADFGNIARPALEVDEPLGRDSFGRSNLSRVVFGARVSLTIAGITVLCGLVLGSIVGLIGGYMGGTVDYIINIFINSTLAFPPLILLITIIAVFKPSVFSISGALVVLSIPSYSRIMRAQTIALREREFVLAARSMGASTRRILIKEILPNAMLAVAAYTFIQAAVVIVAEGSLAFLGLGIPPPRPSWGTMIADGLLKLKTDPHIVFVPAVVMFLTVVSFNRVGDYARRKAIGERDEVS